MQHFLQYGLDATAIRQAGERILERVPPHLVGARFEHVALALQLHRADALHLGIALRALGGETGALHFGALEQQMQFGIGTSRGALALELQ